MFGSFERSSDKSAVLVVKWSGGGQQHDSYANKYIRCANVIRDLLSISSLAEGEFIQRRSAPVV